MSIPLQQDCNMEDPEEHFLWMLVGLPGPDEQAPMMVPPAWLRRWSKRLYDAGARFHPEEQLVKYVPPADNPHWMNGGGGKWVPVDEDLPPEVTAPSIEHLSVGEKLALVEKLKSEGHISEPVQGPVQDEAGVKRRGD